MSLKILVTGGAGYIGSILVPRLLRAGHQVAVVDNFMYGQTSLLDVCSNPNFHIHRRDARDIEFLKPIVQKSDVILPLACLTGAPICDRDPYTAKAVNYDAVRALADLKTKSQMLIFPCTNSGYGVGEKNKHCDENSPLRPVSLYGRLKVELESDLLSRGDCVTFRFATIFGISPRMRLDLLVNDFCFRAVNDGCVVLFEPHFKRNYLHVSDASRAFEHVIQNYSEMTGKTYNVGLSDANLSKKELCEVIKKEIPNFKYLISEIGEDPDKRDYIVSNERIEKTGYLPETSLQTGIQELVRGYQILKRNQYSNV